MGKEISKRYEFLENDEYRMEQGKYCIMELNEEEFLYSLSAIDLLFDT